MAKKQSKSKQMDLIIDANVIDMADEEGDEFAHWSVNIALNKAKDIDKLPWILGQVLTIGLEAMVAQGRIRGFGPFAD